MMISRIAVEAWHYLGLVDELILDSSSRFSDISLTDFNEASCLVVVLV